MPVVPVALGAALLVGVVRIFMALGQPFFAAGDQAVIELQVRLASHFRAVLGPYDRFGWHHLGPTYFYLLAPLYVIGGDHSRALSAGQLFLNAVFAVALVVVVQRRFGWVVGAWAGGLVALMLLAYGPSDLMYPWNPLVLALSVLLTLVLAALGATGSAGPLVWALVVGGFVLQTDVSAGPVVVVCLALGVAGFVMSRRLGHGPGGGSRRRVGVVAGLVVLVVMWVPPAIQTLLHFPGNLGTVLHFFVAAHPGEMGHSLREGLSTLGHQLALNHLNLIAAPASSAVGRFLAVIDVLDAVALCVAGVLLQRRAVLALGAMSLVGLLVAVLSVTRVVGAIFPYLVGWMAVLPVPAWIGTGVLVLDVIRRRARAGHVVTVPVLRVGARELVGAGALVALGLVPVAVLGSRFEHGPTDGYPNFVTAPTLAASVEQGLHRLRSTDVVVHLMAPTCYTAGAGIVDELVKDGLKVHVGPMWVTTFGSTFAADGGETAAVVITDPADVPAPQPPPDAQSVTSFAGDAGPLRLWVVPVRAGGNRR